MFKILMGVSMAAVASSAAGSPCTTDVCRSAQTVLERGAAAEYAKAIADAPGLLTRTAIDSSYAISGNGRLLRSLCEGLKEARLLVLEARRAEKGALVVEQVYLIAAGPEQRAACGKVNERMALKLREPAGSAGTELDSLSQRFVQQLPAKPKVLDAANALERMRKYSGISLLLGAKPAPVIAFLPDIINISTSGTPGVALPFPARPASYPEITSSTSPAIASTKSAAELKKQPPSATFMSEAPASEVPVAYDQLVSDKPGEKVFIEMDAQGNALSYRFDIDPTQVEEGPAPATRGPSPAPSKPVLPSAAGGNAAPANADQPAFSGNLGSPKP